MKNLHRLFKIIWCVLLKCMGNKLLKLSLFMSLFISAHGAIFDYDDRIERYEIKDEMIRSKAKSSVALIQSKFLNISQGKVEILAKTLNKRMNFCSDESFALQKSLANCSGALIGEDLVLTAGHCFDEEFDMNCKDYSFVFDYAKFDNSEASIKPENIYKCEKLVHFDFDFYTFTWIDLAIVKLNRKVKGRTPLKVSFERPSLDDEVFMIGHPLGLPQKVSMEGRVTKLDGKSNSYESNLDSFSVNSGSPVFSKESGDIIGVLVRGTGPNYTNDKEASCNRWYQAKDGDYSDINDLSSLKSIIDNF